MTNYIIKVTHSLTQSQTPATLTSLLPQSRRTEKRTPSQQVPPGLLSIDNGAHGTEKLLLKTQVGEDFA